MPKIINIMISGERDAFVVFEYDPQAIMMMRKESGRKWHAGLRAWRIPIRNADALARKFRTAGYQVQRVGLIDVTPWFE